MNLKKLSPSMLMALGLGCVADACLSPPYEPTESSSSGEVVGPCLTPIQETSTGETSMGSSGSGSGSGGDTTAGMTTGPCLSPPEESTGTTGSETGTDTDAGSESGSGGVMEAPSRSRAEALQRVLDRGALPPDVADRLRRRGQ